MWRARQHVQAAVALVRPAGAVLQHFADMSKRTKTLKKVPDQFCATPQNWLSLNAGS